jgi:DNA-binding transcriptional regulator YiaG
LHAILSAQRTKIHLNRRQIMEKRTIDRPGSVRPSPVPEFSGADIVALRNRHRLSQALFAEVIGVAAVTIREWEGGRHTPNMQCRKLLWLFRDIGVGGFCAERWQDEDET